MKELDLMSVEELVSEIKDRITSRNYSNYKLKTPIKFRYLESNWWCDEISVYKGHYFGHIESEFDKAKRPIENLPIELLRAFVSKMRLARF